jgi:hypothetical protein
MTVCTGPEFTTDGTGRLALANLPSDPWPFASGAAVPASMAAANGLRVDPANGPWVPQVGATPVVQSQRLIDNTQIPFSNVTSGVYEAVVTPWYLTNPSAYQQMVFNGWIEFGLAMYTNGCTWIEHWGNTAYTPGPAQAVATSPWQPLHSESPVANSGFSYVWHSSRWLPVQMVVDIADQQSLTVRHGARPVAGSGTEAQMRDWWVALYGMTYLVDPGPVG